MSQKMVHVLKKNFKSTNRNICPPKGLHVNKKASTATKNSFTSIKKGFTVPKNNFTVTKRGLMHNKRASRPTKRTSCPPARASGTPTKIVMTDRPSTVHIFSLQRVKLPAPSYTAYTELNIRSKVEKRKIQKFIDTVSDGKSLSQPACQKEWKRC
jgi:hypothetical protein